MSEEIAGKRKVLVVEDNELNQEILCAILEDEYEVFTAENGQVGLEMLSTYYRELSLVLLDVYMPVCTGFEFLECRQADVLLSNVPVIVTTGSDNPEDEVKCLKLGASDFVSKPYNPEVVLGRVQSIIKLKESVAALSVVEYDELTGLYTLPAFYHHAQKVLNADPTGSYDLAVGDLEDFKLINSVFGEKKGDELLCYVGNCIRRDCPNGMVARHGDKFFSLRSSDATLADAALAGGNAVELIEGQIKRMMKEAPLPNLKIKVGIYPNVEHSQPVSILCDRVIMAVTSIQKKFAKRVALYDDAIQERLIANKRMESHFEEAIEKKEFVAWYQPKVDTQTEQIVGAEALVRWFTPEGRMIAPYAFIPLFEQDGLIRRLDEYMFERVCCFQRQRMDEGKRVVPISINLSRNSIYQRDTAERYTEILKQYDVSQELVPIELTESAATEGEEIYQVAQQLVEAGFSLQMDDFGSGYSSLSSLTTMPFSVLKMDKSLIDQIGNRKGDIVIRHMVEIAQEMGMKVVAEGVEQREQVDFLKQVGCDMIQGYYFSPPKNQKILEEMLDS